MPRLFTPTKVRGLELSNRVVVAPMCTWFADPETNEVNDLHLVHYGALATGGAGLIIFEGTAVDPRGRIAPADVGIWSDGHIEGLKRITSMVHEESLAKIGLQLAHAGRKALAENGLTRLDGRVEEIDCISSSPLAYSPGWRLPREMTQEDIAEVIELFTKGAQRAVAAGFDWIEIHNAHGYLLNQFTSPLVNKREDEYGGSLENRCRLSLEVAARIRQAIPDDMPLSVRISCVDWAEGGWTVKDSIYLARRLCEECGVDIIHVSSGGVTPEQSISHTWGYQIALSEEVKSGADVKTIAVGGITMAEEANAILMNDDADLVSVGREHLRDPYWTRHQAAMLGLPHWYPPYQRLAYRSRRKKE